MTTPAGRDESPFSLGALVGFRLVIVTVLLFVAGYLGAIQDPDLEPNRAIFALISAAFGLNLIYAILLGLASYRTQAWVQVVGDLLTVSAFVYLTGDDRAGFIILYPIVVLYGTILVGRGFWLATLATLMYVALIAAVRFQKIPAYGLAVLSSSSPRSIGNAVALLALSVLLVAGLGEGVSRSLLRAGQSLDEAAGRFASLRELNSIIVESIQSGLMLTDAADRVVFINEMGAAMLGADRASAAQKNSEEVFGTGRVKPLKNLPEAGHETRIEIERPREDGGSQILGISMVTLGGDLKGGRLFVFRDMTEVHRLEEQARLNEKLAAVGGMAAQMAHEIRNPLGAIAAAARLLAGSAREGEDAQLLDIIARESQRLSGTVDDYLKGLRSAESPEAVCDLVAAVKETARLLQMGPEASSRHQVVIESPHETAAVRIGADELAQVLWNLGRNALEAMPDGGRLTFRVLREDKVVRTDVIDEGHGFDPRRLKRLFEPLQTTKASGTGLGLAIAHRLVRQRGGDLTVTSEAQRGACVTFSLPVAPAARG